MILTYAAVFVLRLFICIGMLDIVLDPNWVWGHGPFSQLPVILIVSFTFAVLCCYNYSECVFPSAFFIMAS